MADAGSYLDDGSDQQQPPPQGQQPPPQGQQQPSFGSNLMSQWNSFIDHPEHRAGLMQFAVNMLSGRGLGESIGAAAEATGRNVTAQQEQERHEEEQALKEQEAKRKERETEYYGIAAKRKPASDVWYEHQMASEDKANRQAAYKLFDDWKKDPVGGAGIMADVTKRFPNVKTKDDLDREGNEAAHEYARQRVMATGGRGMPTERPARQFQPPPGAVPMDVNGNKVWYDPKTKRPVPGQFGG